MAKSSSNGDPCDCAIHIIKALPVDQNIKGVLIPLESRRSSSSSSASTSSRCGLGPYLMTYLEELTLVFPFHPHFASSYQRKQMKWGEWDTFATLVTWYRVFDSWFTWVSRLAPTKLDKWKMLGINEAIHASKYDIPINPSLLIALINFWSPVTNTFSFSEGYMTPTVVDVFALTCLRPMRESAHSLMAFGIGPEEDILNGIPLNYADFIKVVKGASNSTVSYKEECYFYLFWICKFLACTSSKRGISYYLPIAQFLANGTPVNLGSFFLGELYRAMFLLNTDPKQSHVWMDAKYPEEVPSYPTCFKLFSDPSKKRSPEEFTTFKAKKYGSEDFKEFSNQGFFRGNATWGAYLYSRDLVVIRATNAGVKAKLPCYQQRTLSFAGSKAIWLVPINAAFKKAKDGLKLRAPVPQLLATSKQGTRTSIKRKTPEVEKVDPVVSTKDAKPSGKRLIKTVAKKISAKKPKVIEATPDTSIEETVSLIEELDNATTLFALMKDVDQKRKTQAELIEAQHVLEAKDQRIAQEHEEAMMAEADKERKRQEEEAKQQEIEAKAWMKAVTTTSSSIEARSSFESPGDIDKLLEDVSLTLQRTLMAQSPAFKQLKIKGIKLRVKKKIVSNESPNYKLINSTSKLNH
uniref:Aminotransferase-like plant mobile domain-containing protein n=1 Tax=Fagus sylvatica TaxID=28930 RepID=A0A2N9GFN9_FAGSY